MCLADGNGEKLAQGIVVALRKDERIIQTPPIQLKGSSSALLLKKVSELNGTSQKLRLKIDVEETTSFQNRIAWLRHNKWVQQNSWVISGLILGTDTRDICNEKTSLYHTYDE
uniref:Uncharacterized protein n=1 Tax=Romanomermis culicivorax TaxID=13658 RepID=A0A915JRV5_ROMCU